MDLGLFQYPPEALGVCRHDQLPPLLHSLCLGGLKRDFWRRVIKKHGKARNSDIHLVLGRLGQDYHEFKGSLKYISRSFKKQRQQPSKTLVYLWISVTKPLATDSLRRPTDEKSVKDLTSGFSHCH